MSLLSAAAQDEDGDIIRALRAENEQLRQSLLAMHNALEMTAKSGAFYARANEGLRNAVIHWATRAEQAEEMLAAVGAGGVGPLMPATVQHQHKSNIDNDLQRENGHLITSSSIVPAGWKLVPVEPTEDMLYDIQEFSHILPPRGKRIWAHMLAAAPQPPVAEQPQGEQEPVAEITGMDEYGPMLGWHKHWAEFPVGTKLHTHPQPKRAHGIGCDA